MDRNDGGTIVDLQIYRPARKSVVAPKQPRQRRKKDDELPRWRSMTVDERNLALTLISTIVVTGAQPEDTANAISFMFDMAKKAIIEPDAVVTERQVDWLWGLAIRYGLVEEGA